MKMRMSARPADRPISRTVPLWKKWRMASVGRRSRRSGAGGATWLSPCVSVIRPSSGVGLLSAVRFVCNFAG